MNDSTTVLPSPLANPSLFDYIFPLVLLAIVVSLLVGTIVWLVSHVLRGTRPCLPNQTSDDENGSLLSSRASDTETPSNATFARSVTEKVFGDVDEEKPLPTSSTNGKEDYTSNSPVSVNSAYSSSVLDKDSKKLNKSPDSTSSSSSTPTLTVEGTSGEHRGGMTEGDKKAMSVEEARKTVNEYLSKHPDSDHDFDTE